VWLGVSVESEDYVWRVSHLQRTPARVRFLSVEPLLGYLHLDKQTLAGIDLVIVGGESGPRARRMHAEWAIDIQRQCAEAGVTFFFKQWGAYDSNGKRVGKKAAGRLLDGHDWNEMPPAIEAS
jgi:protein gp37